MGTLHNMLPVCRYRCCLLCPQMGCHKTSKPSHVSRTSRRSLHTEAGASPLRDLRRDDHIQQLVSSARGRLFLLHRTEPNHCVQRPPHIFHSWTEDQSCCCGMLCCYPCWLLSWSRSGGCSRLLQLIRHSVWGPSQSFCLPLLHLHKEGPCRR